LHAGQPFEHPFLAEGMVDTKGLAMLRASIMVVATVKREHEKGEFQGR
jgi:hypothetical protein